MTKNFHYNQEAIDFLTKKDPILRAAIAKIGPVTAPMKPDLFSALIKTIIGQQISTKAQETVWRRVLNSLGPVPLSPKKILSLSDNELQAFGLSYRKVAYIKGAAAKVSTGELNLRQLYQLPDEEVIKALTKLKGIGQWTAEMLLTFSMNRQDILSWDDLAIHRGLRMLYHHRRITRKLFMKYKRRYSPYGSIASLYLWEIAEGALPEMKDYAPLTEAEKKRRKKR
ncbi:MAG: hypothetical protein L0K82_00200 [Pisciglobus halotolerans]|nr:hypothetical protein [Pisciglobus halotolerans]